MSVHTSTDHTDVWVAAAKALALWAGYLVSQPIGWWAQLVLIVWTCLQGYVLVRDKIWRREKPPTE